jgi:exonuclease SbcC
LEKNLSSQLQHKTSLLNQQQIFQKAQTEAAAAEAELKGIEEKLARVQQLAIDILTLKQRKEALSHEPVEAWQKEKREMQDLLVLLSNHKELVRQEKLLKGQLKSVAEDETVLSNGIAELVGRISFLSKRASELDVLKEYEELLVTESSLEREVHQFTILSTERDKEYGFAELQLGELEQTLSDKKRITRKLHHYHDLEHWLSESFLKLAQTIERQLFVQIHHEFSEVFSNWFGLLMEEENLTVRLDENFTPVLEQNGYETEVANLSGGEKTAVALAYRLALNRVINDVMSTIKTRDILILDEPTDGFSSEQLDKMRDVLTLLKVKQLIMVSHESKMESLVQHIVRVHKEHHQSSLS